MTPNLKVMTVVGTRPEIIRLSATIRLLEQHTNHVLVHTGQNYDYELNEIFFEELGLRRPDHFLNADVSSLGATLGSIMSGTEQVIREEKPDAMLVLGDTNSCISAVIGKRLQVPVYHMEAGNRSFDENVPEETNRRLVDHVSDYNLAYTEHARRNLLAEGIHPSRIIVTGSPMREVINGVADDLSACEVTEQLGLISGEFFLASLHREENVDNEARLRAAMESFQAIKEQYGQEVLVSTHPRTRKRLNLLKDLDLSGIRFHRPFGFIDYLSLQIDARLVLSDSGTISEESAILDFPAVTMRESTERPEAHDAGTIIACGVDRENVLAAVELTLSRARSTPVPVPYQVDDSSWRVLSFIQSTVWNHNQRSGIRQHIDHS